MDLFRNSTHVVIQELKKHHTAESFSYHPHLIVNLNSWHDILLHVLLPTCLGFFSLDLWHSPWWLCAGSCPSAFSSTKWSQAEWGGKGTTWQPCTSTSPSWARPRRRWWSAALRWSSWAGTSTSMSSKCRLLPGRYGPAELARALGRYRGSAVWR